MNLKEKFFLFFIIVLAFFLRLWRVEKIPSGLYWDEAAIALDAKSISQTGKDHHGNFWLQAIYPSWGDYKLPVYIIFSSLFFKIIPQRIELAVRMPSVIVGAFTVALIYFLSRELFKNEKRDFSGLAFFSSFLLAVSPWHLQFSRAAFEANLALFFNILAFLFFLKANKKILFSFLGVIFSALAIYTYYSARIVNPLILILIFSFYWHKNFKRIIVFVLSIIFLFLLCQPLYFSPLRPKAEQLRLSTLNILNDSSLFNYSSSLVNADKNNFLARIIHHRFLYLFKKMLENYSAHFSLDYFLISGDTNLRHSTGRIGIMFLAAFLALIYGQYQLLRKNIKNFLFLNFCLAVVFLPASVPYEVPHSLRSLNGVVFLNLISAYGLIEFFKKNFFVKISLIFLFCLQLIFYLHDYYQHYPERSYLAWQGGYKEAIFKVKNEYSQAQKIIFTSKYGRPYLYFLLYSNYPLKKFQEQRISFLKENPLNYEETRVIDKIEFKDIDFSKDKNENKVLLIGTSDEIYQGLPIDKVKAFVIWKNY